MNTAVDLVDVGSLRPHPLNPNVGDVDAIAESIRANGWYGVVLVQRSTGYTIAGWHRTLAAQQVGIGRVPVQILDVDDATAQRIMAADNETNRRGRYDDDVLARLLTSISEFDTGLLGSGFNDTDLDDLIAAAETAAYMPPETAPAVETREAEPTSSSPGAATSTVQQDASLPSAFNYRDWVGSDGDSQRRAPDRRLLVMDLPLDRFVWAVDILRRVCEAEAVESNTAAMLLLLSRYSGEEPPGPEEPDG